MPRNITRRTMLRAAGVSLALPWLEAMQPRRARAADGAGVPPKRIAFVYTPNGVVGKAWTPDEVGTDYDLKTSLAPLENVKRHVSVVSGLDRTFAGGTGVHAQCGSCWLTSSAPTESLDGGFPTNVSVDQMIARTIPRGTTLLPSLELSCNDHRDNRETRYFESVSWYGPGYPANVEKNPRDVFRRLFGNPAGDPLAQSVLDVVGRDATLLRKRLGKADREKFDEYLESVRATESRIQNAERLSQRIGKPPIPEPKGIPEDRGQYLRLMGDLLVLAFQLDVTRVGSLVVDPERWDSPRMYHGVFDTPQNHHVLTHTRGDEAVEKLVAIDTFHVAQFAYVVEKMAAIREGEGTLLDNSLLVLGSGLSDGRVHSYKDLPVLLAGGGGGTVKPGRHLRYNGDEPLANLWLTLLGVMGVDAPRFAESTGPLKEVLA